MSFGDRVQQTQTVVDTFQSQLWGQPFILQRLAHVLFGAEHIIPKEIHETIRYTRTATTRHIRFAPDSFVVDRQSPEKTYLLEYKCTQTPLYSRARIQTIRASSPRKDIDWQDIGQWEAEAYDNYTALAGLNIRVAIVNYCAYHDRPLVCDFIDRITPLHRDQVTTNTTTGSRTPFVNFDLTLMRSLEEFLTIEHGFTHEQVAPLCMQLQIRLQSALPVRHHPNSSLYRT